MIVKCPASEEIIKFIKNHKGVNQERKGLGIFVLSELVGYFVFCIQFGLSQDKYPKIEYKNTYISIWTSNEDTYNPCQLFENEVYKKLKNSIIDYKFVCNDYIRDSI